MDGDDPGTTLWTVGRDGREVSCRVRLVRHGIEIDILRDGQLVVTRTFDNETDALAWSDSKRSQRQAEGWRETSNEA